MLTFEEIREIINLINQSSIQHFELEQEETKIVISKTANHLGQEGSQQKKSASDLKVDSLTTVPSVGKGEQVIEKIANDNKNLHEIVSPTVGTFYSTPEPGADGFVKIGEQIQPNTIVCVLEAMKLFNEVEAGVCGEVVEMLAHDGDFIEYGQPLFLVKVKL
ncbi:acetyl-CoA carboxylase biotin carboxyl carrier protein [Pelosinus sp. sgz500959]|uniref:acetyl-CoA carboxylase biotin carboxyl carrier protein n=1 Tax=Pelosinus sp. sgz500959 TaxID=3242472 RepID=UPI00366ECDD3